MKTNANKDKIIKALVKEYKVDQKVFNGLQAIARKEGKSIFRLLSERELIDEEKVTQYLSDTLEIPIVRLSSLRVARGILNMIPKKIIERYRIFPISRAGNMLAVATSDPFDLMVKDDLRELIQCDVIFTLSTPKTLNDAIDSYYGESANIEEVLDGIDADSLEVIQDDDRGEEHAKVSHGGVDDAPVVRLVKLIIDEAIKSRASDIHFEPYEHDFRVRYRIDGALKESFANSRDLYNPLVARIKIMSAIDITEKRLPQDGRFRVRLKEREIDFRVSILPIYHGEKMVLRILDKSGVKSGLQNLGFSEKPTGIFAEAVKNPYGMILVTGPTGSGKSTTLYTILNTLNTLERNIMTVEDPVEYQLEGITQTQVNADVGLSFANGLRSLLRQSPDIILVGEIRDTETGDIAVKAALTGHLVFSTLHTNSAAGAMTRLVDMGIEPFLISSSVLCVAAQRLMRRVCHYCKEEYEVPEETLQRCGMKPEDLKNIVAYRGKGCSRCNHTGYYGRLGAIEVLKVDAEIRELVLAGKSSDAIEASAVRNGMETLFQNAFSIFANGLTTLEEVLRITSKD